MAKRQYQQPIEGLGRIQRLLIFYSALGIFAISVVVASISVLPFYQQLRQQEEKNLRFSLHTKGMAIKEFLFRAKDVAEQIASRTQARTMLLDYNQGKISRKVASQNITRFLLDALNQSEDVVGITRITYNNKLVAQVGLPIPSQFQPKLPINSKNAVVSAPILVKGQSYLVVTKSIFNSAGEEAGADIILFKTSRLQNIVKNNVDLGKTGEIILGTIKHNRVELFFSSSNSQYQSYPKIFQGMSKAISGKSGLLIGSESPLKSNIVAFESLPNNWGLVIKINSQELYASIHQQFFIILITAVFMSGLGTSVVIILLRPLSGKVLIHANELEQQVQEKIAAIEELKKTQAQLIQTEKMSGLGQLVAGVAHEINNPVSFIYGNIKCAEEYVENLLQLIEIYQNTDNYSTIDIEEYIEYIELEFLRADLPKLFTSMKEGATRIRDIVLSLQNFSRTDEAGMKLVDIHQGIESTLLILQHRLKLQSNRSEIQVIKKYGELPLVECHANQINQVFMNLLTNGIDALETYNQEQFPFNSQGNSNEMTITIYTEMLENNWVIIRISDNGAGISEAILNRLFEPFFTTKPVGQGTGLGLSISYQIIVKQHGGKLWCDSIKGEGTEFTIHIPIRQE